MAVLVSGPAHGSLILNLDGSFGYTPQVNFNGADSFTYKVTDGNLDSNVATVSITVLAVNDPPRGTANPASLKIAEDSLATTVTLSATDIETLASNLRFTITTVPRQ